MAEKKAAPIKSDESDKNTSKPISVTGYKGFDPEWKCRDGFQYEVGKTYETESASLCNSGFHFCLNALDVFRYYGPVNGAGKANNFASVEASDLDEKTSGDTKRAANKIRIRAKLDIGSLIKAGIDFIWQKVSTDESAQKANGDRSTSAANGYGSTSKVVGKDSIALAHGIESRASGSLDCWIVLSEWEKRDGEWHVKDVKCAKVDGKEIRPDVLYVLKNGEFVAIEN